MTFKIEEHYIVREMSSGGKLKIPSREYSKEEYENSYLGPYYDGRYKDICDEDYRTELEAQEAILKEGVVDKEYIVLRVLTKKEFEE